MMDVRNTASAESSISSVAARMAKRLALSEMLAIVVLLVVVSVFTVARRSAFLGSTNITALLLNSSVMAVTAAGMSLALAMRGFDLSVGSIMACSATVIAQLAKVTGLYFAIPAGLAIGICLGYVNGLSIAKFRIPPFIATLGMLSIARGIVYIITRGTTVIVTDHPELNRLATTSIAGLVPLPFIVALVFVVVMHVVFRHTRFGRHIAGIGGNPVAAASAGINTYRYTLVVYMIVGFCAAFSGLLQISQVMVIDPSAGTDLALSTIVIAVLGGASLAGGKANFPAVMIASLLVAVINSSLNMLNVKSFYQYIALGLLLIFAVLLDSARQNLISRLVTVGNTGGAK